MIKFYGDSTQVWNDLSFHFWVNCPFKFIDRTEFSIIWKLKGQCAVIYTQTHLFPNLYDSSLKKNAC